MNCKLQNSNGTRCMFLFVVMEFRHDLLRLRYLIFQPTWFFKAVFNFESKVQSAVIYHTQINLRDQINKIKIYLYNILVLSKSIYKFRNH